MNNKIIMSILGIAIGIILVGSVLAPVISDAQDSQIEYYNNNYGIYAKVLDTEPHTASYTYDASTQQMTYSVDGAAMPIFDNSNVPLVSTSSFALKYVHSSTSSNYFIYLDESGSHRFDNVQSLEIEFNNNSATISGIGASNQAISVTLEYEWAFINHTSGEYRGIWNGAHKIIYVNDLSQAYGSSWVGTTNGFFSYHGTEANVNNQAYEATYQVDPVEGITNVSSFDLDTDLVITIDNGGTSYDIHPYVILVPQEIVGDKSDNSQALISLYGVIPAMVLVALLASAVRIVRTRD